MRLYVSGKAQNTVYNTSQFNGLAMSPSQGTRNVAIVAWDSAGNAYNNTRPITSGYSFGWASCPSSSSACTPGFADSSLPARDSYVGNSFLMNAEILDNAAPITRIKAYIDNTIVATSSGKVLKQEITNAPAGTHILTYKAWDAAGVLYRVQYNINIAVPH